MRALFGVLMLLGGILVGAFGTLALFVNFLDNSPEGNGDRLISVVFIIIGVSLYNAGKKNLLSVFGDSKQQDSDQAFERSEKHLAESPRPAQLDTASSSTAALDTTVPSTGSANRSRAASSSMASRIFENVTVSLIISAVTAIAGKLVGG